MSSTSRVDVPNVNPYYLLEYFGKCCLDAMLHALLLDGSDFVMEVGLQTLFVQE